MSGHTPTENYVACPACEGRGTGQGDNTYCGYCGGDGSVPESAGLIVDPRENLIDTAWQAIDDRNDVDVSLRDFAEAAVDAIAAPETAAERDRLKEINADLLEALTLWKAADEEPHEDARQVMRGLAREKRNAAISRAETPDTGAQG